MGHEFAPRISRKLDLMTEAVTEERARLKHSRASRWMHWINFPLLAIMIWSGLRIYWANDIYRLGWGDTTLFQFLPEYVNSELDLDRHLARGLAFHLNFAWLFLINGVAYVGYMAISGEWRQLLPERGFFRDSQRVVAHDLHLTKKPPPPQGRYNAAQRLTYTLVIVLGAVALFSGFAIFKPTQLSFVTSLLGGYEVARFIHFYTTIAFLLFFVIHILQVLRAGFDNFWSMVIGYERERPGHRSRANVAAEFAEIARQDAELADSETTDPETTGPEGTEAEETADA
ncbi:MAG: thiosulfate reductase cytochrome b subunit [Candidatus Poriferisodalaceae bacterium]|jgi:thiosulfate reductase cytochrome b subunit